MCVRFQFSEFDSNVINSQFSNALRLTSRFLCNTSTVFSSPLALDMDCVGARPSTTPRNPAKLSAFHLSRILLDALTRVTVVMYYYQVFLSACLKRSVFHVLLFQRSVHCLLYRPVEYQCYRSSLPANNEHLFS